MATKKRTEQTPPPAKTLEERENQMVALAVDLAEKQLRDGTATAQVITHYLKLATIRETKEREKMELENELLKARTEAIIATQKSEVAYAEVMDAFKKYSGSSSLGTFDD